MPPIFSFTHIINGFLQSHKLDECNELFVTGGPHTTPHLTTIYPSVPSPWRSACLFIIMLSLCLGFILVEQYARIELHNVKLFMGAVTVGNIFAPLSLVLLLSELNLWRNIQVLRLGYLITGGGLLSIAFALCMYLFSTAESPVMSAVSTGTVEELAKVAACIVLAGPTLRNGRILNGMLIGAAVGAGFSLIESMGYTFEALLAPAADAEAVQLSYGDALSTMGLRGLFAMTSGHVMWGAVSCGALWGCHRLHTLGHALHQPKFLLALLFCIMLHSGWNVCCYTGMVLPALPVLILLTWGGLGFTVYGGIKQVRTLQSLWYDTASEDASLFSLRRPDGVWALPISAAQLQERLEADSITRGTLCRVGDCSIPVPVWHLSFIPKEPEPLCSWWRTPRCGWYLCSFLAGAAQLLTLLGAVLRPESLTALLLFAAAMLSELILNFCWLTVLWKRMMRRFPQNEEERLVSAISPHSMASLWKRTCIPLYNILWGYRLYVNLIQRFNATGLSPVRIPLWIPRLYWGNIAAAGTLLLTMAILHQGEANMWHFLILILLYPILAFFMSRAMNCIHNLLREGGL